MPEPEPTPHWPGDETEADQKKEPQRRKEEEREKPKDRYEK
jgi:hypothetical protein